MKQTFSIEIFNEHPIINVGDKRVLVDTGSPETISNQQSIRIMGTEHKCNQGILSVDVAELSRLVGTQIDVLLGTDILSQYRVEVDYGTKKLILSDKEEPFGYYWVRVRSKVVMGIFCIQLSVDGKDLWFALDTGAKVSYLSKELLSEAKHLGQVEDFYPGIGSFKSEIYQSIASADCMAFPVLFGNTPMIDLALSQIGVSGIIGFDLFESFRVGFDFKRKEICLTPYHEKKPRICRMPGQILGCDELSEADRSQRVQEIKDNYTGEEHVKKMTEEALRGNAEAMYKLCNIYEGGTYAPKDFNAAAYWCVEATRHGLPEAKKQLFYSCRNEDEYKHPAFCNHILDWFVTESLAGNPDTFDALKFLPDRILLDCMKVYFFDSSETDKREVIDKIRNMGDEEYRVKTLSSEFTDKMFPTLALLRELNAAKDE